MVRMMINGTTLYSGSSSLQSMGGPPKRLKRYNAATEGMTANSNTNAYHWMPTRQIKKRPSNSRTPPFRPSTAVRMIPARLALSAPSCEAPWGSSPAATATKGATPRIMARTTRDAAGYFLTIVDIFSSLLRLVLRIRHQYTNGLSRYKTEVGRPLSVVLCPLWLDISTPLFQ
jgi:hypothetical protein